MDYVRGFLFALLFTICASQPSFAQKTRPAPARAKPATLPTKQSHLKLSDWMHLIQSQKCQQAKKLCTPYAHAGSIAKQVEAQKCLANVSLCGADVVHLQRGKGKTVYLSDSYIPAAVDASLKHLNIALKLAPQDITIHQGRLHILEIAGRYKEMAKALDQSCSIYKGKDAPNVWLAYPEELESQGHYKAAMQLTAVLYKHYPNSSDIVANMGAFMAVYGNLSAAIPYLLKAVKLAPNDPINTWDLGRAYDLTNQIQLANHWYQKGLALQKGKSTYKASSCIYGHFVGKKLHDKTRACQLETANCAAKDRTDCPKPAKSTTSKKN